MLGLTLAGISIFTPIRRPLTLGIAAAVSVAVLLRWGGVHRRHLAFGLVQTVLQKKTPQGQIKKYSTFKGPILYTFPELSFFMPDYSSRLSVPQSPIQKNKALCTSQHI